MTVRSSPITTRLLSAATATLMGLAGTLGTLTMTGCTDDDERYGTPPPMTPTGATESAGTSTPTPTPTPTPTGTDEQQIIAQYRRFWLRTLPAGAAATAGQRRKIFEPVVTEPELSILVKNFAYFDRRGEKAYGASTPLRQTVRISGATALVTGCIDSRKTGRVNARSGKKLTKGYAQNPVRANLKRGADSAWRVSAVIFPGGTRC